MILNDFKKMAVWVKSRELVKRVYLVSGSFPPSETYGMTAQTRRAAVSVAANIAEGCGRRGAREFSHFVDIALGSAYELECHLVLAIDLSFVDRDVAASAIHLLDEVKRMLVGLSKRLRATPQ